MSELAGSPGRAQREACGVEIAVWRACARVGQARGINTCFLDVFGVTVDVFVGVGGQNHGRADPKRAASFYSPILLLL